MLSNTIVDNLYGLRREEVHKSVRQIYQRINTPIDIGILSFATAIDAMMRMIGSTSMQGKKAVVDVPKFKEVVAELMVLLGRPNISDIFPFLAWFDLQGIEKETKKVIGVIEGMLDSAIEHTRKNVNHNKQRKGFLQFLVDLHENGDDVASITKTQVKALLSVRLSAYTQLLVNSISKVKE